MVSPLTLAEVEDGVNYRRGQTYGRERILRSDHQHRSGVTRRSGAGKYHEKQKKRKKQE
jgi:hypothetical protein